MTSTAIRAVVKLRTRLVNQKPFTQTLPVEGTKMEDGSYGGALTVSIVAPLARAR